MSLSPWGSEVGGECRGALLGLAVGYIWGKLKSMGSCIICLELFWKIKRLLGLCWLTTPQFLRTKNGEHLADGIVPRPPIRGPRRVPYWVVLADSQYLHPIEHGARALSWLFLQNCDVIWGGLRGEQSWEKEHAICCPKCLQRKTQSYQDESTQKLFGSWFQKNINRTRKGNIFRT